MWMNDPMSSIDAENIEKNVSDAYKSMHKAIKQFADFESNPIVLLLFFPENTNINKKTIRYSIMIHFSPLEREAQNCFISF